MNDGTSFMPSSCILFSCQGMGYNFAECGQCSCRWSLGWLSPVALYSLAPIPGIWYPPSRIGPVGLPLSFPEYPLTPVPVRCPRFHPLSSEWLYSQGHGEVNTHYLKKIRFFWKSRRIVWTLNPAKILGILWLQRFVSWKPAKFYLKILLPSCRNP